MTPRHFRRALNLGVAKRALEAAIARGDARLIGLATAHPDLLYSRMSGNEIGRLVDAGMRRRAWLRVLTAKLAGSALSEAVAGWLYQSAIREHPRRERIPSATASGRRFTPFATTDRADADLASGPTHAPSPRNHDRPNQL